MKYIFDLTDNYYNKGYYDWLKDFVSQLKGAEITNQNEQIIEATLDNSAASVVDYLIDVVDAIPSSVTRG